MKYRIFQASHQNKIFKAVEDNPDIGWYLYVFENNKIIKDYLQNDLEMCIKFSNKYFSVPISSWEFVGYDQN